MTATDVANREIKVLIKITSQTEAQKPTTVARSKDHEQCVEIINNCITIQDNAEHLEGVDCSSLDQSRYTRQLMPGARLRDDGETTPIMN
jgi:hypothetical protein